MLGRFITFGERAAGDTALACAPAGPPAEMAASAAPITNANGTPAANLARIEADGVVAADIVASHGPKSLTLSWNRPMKRAGGLPVGPSGAGHFRPAGPGPAEPEQDQPGHRRSGPPARALTGSFGSMPAGHTPAAQAPLQPAHMQQWRPDYHLDMAAHCRSLRSRLVGAIRRLANYFRTHPFGPDRDRV